MQWFKGAMVVSSMLFAAAAFSTQGCSGGGGSKDGGGSDAISSPDGKKPDGGGTDGSKQCTPGSGLSCEQCDTSGFSPSAQSAPFQHANKCPAADIAAYITACGQNATSSSCPTWQQAENTSNAACLSCIYSGQTNANWGPLICPQSGFCSYNFPGCIDIKLGQVSKENSTATGSCGDRFSAGYGCQDYACGACLTGADGGFDSTSYTACDKSATGASGECASYISAINSAPECSSFQGDAGSPADSCFPADSNAGFTDTEFSAFVTMFCGQ